MINALPADTIKIEIPLHVKKKPPEQKTATIMFFFHRFCPPLSSK
jgi:hypothetical protein